METTFFGILLSIVTNLIASVIFEGLRGRVPFFPGPSTRVEEVPSFQVFDARSANRENLSNVLSNIWFYFSTLYLLYVCVSFPPAVKSHFFSQEVPLFLNDARIFGWLLPDKPVTGYFQFEFAVITLVLYLPILYLVTLGAIPVAIIANKFIEVTLSTWRTIQAVVFLIPAYFVAALSVYGFSTYDFGVAFWVPALVILLVIVGVVAMIGNTKR